MAVLWCFLLLVLLICFFFFMIHLNNLKCRSHDLPPGEMGYPILGENLEFLSSSLSGNPEKFIQARVKKYSSQIFKTSIVGKSVMFFCGPSANKFVFHNQQNVLQSWWPTALQKIFPTESSFLEENKKIRTLFPAFLKSDSIKRYISVMDTMTKHHIETHWDSKIEVVALPLIMKCTFTVGCRLLASVEDDMLMKKIENKIKVVSIGALCFPYNISWTPLHRSMESSNFVRNELVGIIKKRKIELVEEKVSPSQDILTAMLVARDDEGKLLFPNEGDIASLIFILLTASYYTTTSTLTFVMKYLADYPCVHDLILKEQMEIVELKKVGEELNWEDLQRMKYTWNVVCEVMRLMPPLQGSFREAVTDFYYQGFRIPKGWKVFWNPYSTHMDPKCFPNPKEFNPSRFEGRGPAPFTFVAFGGGSHACPGIQYARCLTLIFLHYVVTKFKWEKVVEVEKVVFDPLPQPEKGLPIRLHSNQNMKSKNV